LKQKALKKSVPLKTAAKLLWPWFSFIFVASWLFLPGTVFADATCATNQGNSQLCDLSGITLKTDIKINGQSTNFVKVGQADGSFQLEVKITLVSPPTLTLNSTNINLTLASTTPDSAKFQGFGAVATPGSTSGVCAVKTNGAFGTGFTYQNCSNSPFDFTQNNSSVTGPVFQAGQTVFDATFTVGSSNLSKLGITQLNNGTDPNSGVNQIYVYPGVGFGNTFYNTYFNGGIGAYVQLFGTQAQANAATGQPTACTSTNPNTPAGCVPGYGGSTSSGTNVGTAPTLSDRLAQLINGIISNLLAFIQLAIYGIFANLIAPIIVAVLSIHAYQDSFVAVIYSGWETIRNLCDIFFIVALIIIAMATLFRVESYKARHLLVQLIIAALLINFSLVIGQAILALADTVQAQFLPSNLTAINNLAKNLMTTNNSAISAWYRDTTVTSTSNAVNTSLFGGTFASLFWLAMSMGTFAVFLAIAVFLVIRVIALWLLLMISPVAYAAGVLPSTSHYREEWWKNFLKYAFFTPIMAFFLNMTAIMASNAQTNKILQAAATSAGITDSNSFANLIVTIGSNILLLVFLIASLEVAKQAGIYGAEGINKLAKQGIFAPFAGAAWGVKHGASFGAEVVHEKYHVQLNPMKWVEGFKESREINRKRREAAGMLGAEGESTLANPASFFQRYWSIKGMTGITKMRDVRGKKLLDEALKLEDEAEKLQHQADHETDVVKKAALITEKLKIQGKIVDLEKRGKALVAPADYLTQQHTRHAVNEEKGNVHGETWEELVELSEGALQEGNMTRYLAIAQKLTETYNENELFNHTRYGRDVSAAESADGVAHSADEFIGDGWAGLENFRRFILQDKFKMNEQASARFMADITDIAEKKNHTGIMRVFGVKYGKYRHKPYHEWNNEVSAEKGKMRTGSVITDNNRLGGNEEIPAMDYAISQLRVQLLQENQLDYYLKNWNAIKFLAGRGQLNPSQAKAAAMPQNAMRIIAAADKLEHKMVEAKDVNGQTVFEKNDKGETMKDASGKAKALLVDQHDEALRTLKDLFIGYGLQQMSPGEMESHHKALQELLNNKKIEGRYKDWIKDAQAQMTTIAAAHPTDQNMQEVYKPFTIK
jgi:hypothetical protein